MTIIARDRLEIDLRAAFADHQCVQLWIGYATNLFLGFGDDFLDPMSDGRPRMPLYQLHTQFSEWSICDEHKVKVDSESEIDRAKIEKEAADMLLGLKPSQWRVMNDRPELQIEFGTGLLLRVSPYVEEEFALERAWSLRNPAGIYLDQFCDGLIVSSKGDNYVRHPLDPVELSDQSR